MTDWNDPDFVDETPQDENGWPEPAHPSPDEASSATMRNIDETFPTEKALEASKKHKTGKTTGKGVLGSPVAHSVLPVALSALVSAVVWVLMSISVTNLAGWLVAILAGFGVYFCWKFTSKAHGLIAAAAVVSTAAMFWLAPVLALAVAICAICLFVMQSSEV